MSGEFRGTILRTANIAGQYNKSHRVEESLTWTPCLTSGSYLSPDTGVHMAQSLKEALIQDWHALPSHRPGIYHIAGGNCALMHCN